MFLQRTQQQKKKEEEKRRKKGVFWIDDKWHHLYGFRYQVHRYIHIAPCWSDLHAPYMHTAHYTHISVNINISSFFQNIGEIIKSVQHTHTHFVWKTECTDELRFGNPIGLRRVYEYNTNSITSMKKKKKQKFFIFFILISLIVPFLRFEFDCYGLVFVIIIFFFSL